jgi:hypothetical protein
MISLYQKYLVADQMMKRLESVGMMPGSVHLSTDGEVIAYLGYGEFGDDQPLNAWSSPARREAAVNEFLTRYPDSAVTREPDYSGKPQMVVTGETNLGVRWKIDFRDGVCEKVQVGTKKVERADPAAYDALPRVIVEEPIYEYRCPDPIVQAVNS